MYLDINPFYTVHEISCLEVSLLFFRHDKTVAAAFAIMGGKIQIEKISIVKLDFTVWGSNKYGSCQMWCCKGVVFKFTNFVAIRVFDLIDGMGDLYGLSLINWHNTTINCCKFNHLSDLNSSGMPLERDRVAYPCDQHLFTKNKVLYVGSIKMNSKVQNDKNYNPDYT